MNTSPIQNTGMQRPNREKTLDEWSKNELGFAPDTMPMGKPITRVRIIEATVSNRVSGQVSPMRSETGAISLSERPRSPWATLPTYST